MPLDATAARKYIRAEYGIDVDDDDPVLAPYMLTQLGFEHLEPEFRELAAKVATDIVNNSVVVLEQAHGSIVKVGQQVASMQGAMKATVEAAEKAERLNAMLDEKIAALDERLARSDEIAKEATKAAHTCNQAVVALTSGLLKVQTKGGFWKK